VATDPVPEAIVEVLLECESVGNYLLSFGCFPIKV